MKEYRLIAWPELPAPFQGTAYRRMLSDMSHRYRSLKQLMKISGARREEVREFLDSLDSRGLLLERELFGAYADAAADGSLTRWTKIRAQLGRLLGRQG